MKEYNILGKISGYVRLGTVSAQNEEEAMKKVRNMTPDELDDRNSWTSAEIAYCFHDCFKNDGDIELEEL